MKYLSIILFLLFSGCTNKTRFFMEVVTRDARDDRTFVRLYEMESNTGIRGHELEKNFYCTYWLEEVWHPKELGESPPEVIGASVECQPCHQNESCEGTQDMTVKNFDGSSILKLNRNSEWWHAIKFIKMVQK